MRKFLLWVIPSSAGSISLLFIAEEKLFTGVIVICLGYTIFNYIYEN